MDSDKACRIMQDAFDSKYPIKIEIARMLPEQIPQTAAIEAEVFTQPWSEQAFADALDLEQALFYTASVNGAVAGYCGIYLAADEGEITNVAVAPLYRRRKIAESLLKQMLTDVSKKGVRQVFLEVRVSNASAIRLYEKLGFEAVGGRKGFYQQPVEDAVVMRVLLAKADFIACQHK